MGGKHKVANRTKNNARPSSSGRSAELLSSSLPTFGVFSGASTTTSLSNSLPSFVLNVEELDSSIDVNFQLVLKKISKKDSTTKSKGLQEFKDLVKNSDPEVVKAILPTWSRFYNVLSTDSDNRVREETHNVHHEIVLKVKRNLAPFLKQLMPPWFTSQYDTYPPAASAATLAFQDAFPVHKSHDVIVFCQSEILAYIHENLLIQTAQTLSPKNTSPEDAESKHIRVLTSCLQGYYLYLEKVAPDKIQEVLEANQQIATNAKFWKFAKHSIPSIRSAWFKVVKNICQKAMFLLSGKEAQLLTIIFNNLEEEEPTVLPHAWECVLLVVSEVEDWWKFISVEKLFIPKLMSVLKKAGQGNATVMYPNILPLISHLPPLKDEMQFYTTFFNNFVIGLKLKSVISSRSESSAVAAAFVECLQYVIIKNSTNSGLCKTLTEKHLLPVIEWCLTNKASNHKTVFKQTAIFVQCLSRNNQSETLNTLLREFFVAIEKIFGKVLLEPGGDGEDISSIADKQIEFILCLKQNHRVIKQSKVKFATEEDPQKSCRKTSKSIRENDDSSYKDILENLVINICVQYSALIEEQRSKYLIEKLCSLIVDFNSKNFFDRLLENDKKPGGTTLITIYDTVLKQWLISEDLLCKSVIHLVFLLFSHLDDQDKTNLLGNLLKLNPIICLQWAISEALAYPYREDPLVKLWLKSREISDFFISTTERIIRNECPPELNVLYKLALTENEEGELPIDNQALKEIVAKISTSLSKETHTVISQDPCLSLASYLCNIIYTENLLLTHGTELLLALFEQACKIVKDTENISTETIFELNSAWQDTVINLFACLSKEEIIIVTEKFAEVVETEFVTCTGFEIEQINHFATVLTNFLKACFRSVPLMVQDLKNLLFERKRIHGKKEDIFILYKIGKYIDGSISDEVPVTPCVSELEVLQYFIWSYIKMAVLSSDVGDYENYDDEDYDNDDAKTVEMEDKVYILSLTDDMEPQIVSLIEDYYLGESLLYYYTNIKNYDELLQYNTLLQDKLFDIVNNDSFKKIDGSDVSLLNNILKGIQLNLPLTKTFAYLNSVYVDRCCREIEKYGADALLQRFEKVEAVKNENVALFLLEDVSLGDCKQIETVIDTIRHCTILMDCSNAEFFERKYWDFVILALVSWSNYCYKSRASLDKYQYQAILVSATNLHKTISVTINKRFLKKVYVDEWEDILCEGIHNNLAQVWLYLADELSNKANSGNCMSYLPLIQNFGTFTNFIRHDLIFKPNDNFPKWTKFLKRSCSLLKSPLPSLQIWGHRMLLALIPGFVKLDLEAVQSDTPQQKGLIFEQFKGILPEFQEVVSSIVSEFRLGEETCRIQPSTDAFTYTLAYLLLWDVLLTLCQSASADLRYQYADWLKSDSLLNIFLSSLLSLMPNDVLRYSKGKAELFTTPFMESPLPDDHCFSKHLDAEVIQHLSCFLYKSSLTHLPALVRQWWTDLDTRLSQIVDKITALYVSPLLCSEELYNVLKHQQQYKNMTFQIRLMPSVREILAVYTVDEAQMELAITLPANYPLGSPQIECNRPIVGTHCGGWLLQFKKCVFHQNGRLSDGLSLWYNNLDRKFDGVEECYICFAVLHSGTYQLPRLTCQTCKKKFHSACLYKWFSTSNKSSCPICRNLF